MASVFILVAMPSVPGWALRQVPLSGPSTVSFPARDGG